MFFLRLSLLMVLLSLPSTLKAAACCSGGGNLSSLITNDDKFHARLSLANDFVVGRVTTGSAIFNDDITEQRNLTSTLSAAYAISPRWQTGLSLPFQYKVNGDRSKSGLGDFRVNAAYEVFPLYEYSAWRPRVFAYVAAIFPTGESAYNSQDPVIGSFGRGFYSMGGGFVFSKDWARVDAFFSHEFLHSFDRSFAQERVSPGFSYTNNLGAGYHWGNFRLGGNLGLQYEESRKFLRSGNKRGFGMLWNTGAEATYRWSDALASSLSYNDQTLLGPARHSSLNRTLAFSFRYRVPR